MSQKLTMSRTQIQAAVDALPREHIAAMPTPLQEMPNLSKALGGPRILVKREDLTGLAMGGNKVRHMDFCMGDALAKGADVSINVNLPSSNNSRIIGAASKKAGLHFVCVVPDGKHAPIQGNLLVLSLMGAELHLLDTTDPEEVKGYTTDLAQKFRNEGHTAFVHTEDMMSRESGSIAFIEATLELSGQLANKDVDKASIYVVAGASHGGLIVGSKLLGLPWDIQGVLTAEPSIAFVDVVGWANGATRRLGIPLQLTWDDVQQTDDYLEPGYGKLNPGCVEAIQLVAETEGIILDPVYTGKAMAALIDHVRQGLLTTKDTVVFMHTGGLPETFNYAEGLKRD